MSLVNRQQIFELYEYLSDNYADNDMWISFALQSFGLCDFIDMEKDEVIDPLTIVPDEDLLKIFDQRYEFDNIMSPVWDRGDVEKDILDKFPFIYDYTFNHLVYPAMEILKNRGKNFPFRDFCVEFMSLYQCCMTYKEKLNWDIKLKEIYNMAKIYKEPKLIHDFRDSGIYLEDLFEDHKKHKKRNPVKKSKKHK